MNKTQEKLLQIAKEFMTVCDKLNLSYFAIGGTALGAARHKGFIPWDDDIDFVMPRKDFEIFISEGQKYVNQATYFIQTHKTDPHYFYPYAKLRNSTTTAIELSTRKLDINHGLWIDIFPLDYASSSEKITKRINKRRFLLFERRFLIERYSWGGFKNSLYNLIIRVLIPTKRMAFNLYNKMLEKYNVESNFLWWNWNRMGKPILKKEWFENYKEEPFENINIRVSDHNEDYLKSHFGDWKQLPPKHEQKSMHSFYILDLDKPYTFYI